MAEYKKHWKNSVVELSLCSVIMVVLVHTQDALTVGFNYQGLRLFGMTLALFLMVYNAGELIINDSSKGWCGILYKLALLTPWVFYLHVLVGNIYELFETRGRLVDCLLITIVCALTYANYRRCRLLFIRFYDRGE